MKPARLGALLLSLFTANAAAPLPEWLSAYDQASRSSGTPASYVVKASISTVVEFYKAQIRKAGIEFLEAPAGEAGASIKVITGTLSCLVRIGPEPGPGLASIGTRVRASCTDDGPKLGLGVSTVAAGPTPTKISGVPLHLWVIDKNFIPADPSAQRYESNISLRCTYRNDSMVDIRAFTGFIQFQDLFARPIYTLRVTISEPVPRGQMGSWDGFFKYNQFVEAQQRLMSTSLQDMKPVWMLTSVILTDGTQIGTPQ
jgi:hypothetical protein